MLSLMKQGQKNGLRTPTLKMIGKRLARVRQQKGLSQSELSRRTGIAQALISGYEAGRVRMGADVVAQFAITLGVSTDEILALKGVKERPAIRPLSRKVQRRAEMLEDIPPLEQKHILRALDTLIKGAGK